MDMNILHLLLVTTEGLLRLLETIVTIPALVLHQENLTSTGRGGPVLPPLEVTTHQMDLRATHLVLTMEPHAT